jgi:uncharacterized membrane protein
MSQHQRASPVPTPAEAELQRNISQVMRLEQKSLRQRTRGERVADAVTAASGSIPFILFHVVLFVVWIVLNLGYVSQIRPFDPWPGAPHRARPVS